MTHRRKAIRQAVRELLNGLPLRTPDTLPAVLVSTPDEAPAEEGGYVAGATEVDVVLAVTVYAVDEDGVDDQLADVEQRIAADQTLRGTVSQLNYTSYALEADDAAYNGVATWTARVLTEEV